MENEFALTQGLRDCRDNARLLLGLRYPGVMARYGLMLKRIAAHDKTSVLIAAIKVGKDPELNAQGRLQVLAAAVEIMDPTSAPTAQPQSAQG